MSVSLVHVVTFFKKCQKLNEGINSLDFSSNIDNAIKAIAKVFNNRIEKLSSLLHANDTQLNVTNRNEISIESDNLINESILKG